MRVHWYEAIESRDRMILRWTAQEKRYQFLSFAIAVILATAFIVFLARAFIPAHHRRNATLAGGATAGMLLLVRGGIILRGRNVVLDRQQDKVLENGSLKSKLSEFNRLTIQRIHHHRAAAVGDDRLSYRVIAIRPDDSRMILGEMDERDALETSRALAKYLNLPLSWG